jgi:protein gp37
MAENSAISWTTHTWNPWIGCSKVSPACDGCYAEAIMDKRYHRVQWGAPGQGAGTRSRTSKSTWDAPLKWQRQAVKDGTRPFVFCASLADIFDNQVPAEWRREAFEVMRKTPNLVYLLLTKRPQNIVKLSDAAGGLPRNAALGTTVEDQKRADINVPHLLAAKWDAKPLFAFVSCEPLIGPIDLTRVRARSPMGHHRINALDGNAPRGGAWWGGNVGVPEPPRVSIDWVITGGETDQGGHKARPTHPDWFRSLRDQCTSHGKAFHHKQNGEWVSVSEVAGPGAHFKFDDGATVRRVGKNPSGRTIDGVTHDAFPQIGGAA